MAYDRAPKRWPKKLIHMQDNTPHHLVIWGMYDASKPHTAIIVETLAQIPTLTTTVIHKDIWQHKHQDASSLSIFSYMIFFLRMLAAYPSLIIRYLRAPKHSHVLVLYPCWMDTVVLWIFAKIRRATIICDMFISLYDTAVIDRRLVKKKLPQYMIKQYERMACKLADIMVLDTKAHSDYAAHLLEVKREKFAYAYIGTKAFFRPSASISETPRPERDRITTVLFYGQMIPLHGIETIIDAALLAEEEPIHWHIIGSGQQDFIIKEKINASHTHITHTPWVAHEDLPALIASSDMCLGVFGTSRKARNVIPHKVYECLAMGKTVITLNGDAMQEIYPSAKEHLVLLDNPSPEALLSAIKKLANQPVKNKPPVTYGKQRMDQWVDILSRTN